MAEENTENLDSPNEEQETTDSPNSEANTEEYTEREKQLYARLKKAEGFVQDENGKWVKPPKPKAEEKPERHEKQPDKDEHILSYKDTYALQEAKVQVDDVDEVVRFAKFSGQSVAEALKDPTLTAILNTRIEQRKTAQATNKGGGKASTKKVSADELVQNASKGQYPDRGTPEAEELFWARRGGRPS